MSDIILRSIRSVNTVNAEVKIPPSKSYTNRALIVSALAEGNSSLMNVSSSDDSAYLISALQKFGIEIHKGENTLDVTGSSGILSAPADGVFIGNAGTAMRFLSTFSCLAKGQTTISGDEQMQKRTIQDLLTALQSSGVKVTSNNGFPPVTIHGGNFKGGTIFLNGSISSQYVSSILLSAPFAKNAITLIIKGKLSSAPYVDMSLHVMRSFGANIEVIEPCVSYYISNADKYIGEPFEIESDASAATYFMATAAITGGKIIINGISTDSLQGDIKFIDILSEMGCRISKQKNVIEVHGGSLKGIDVDMNQLPDCVPTLAVVAAFAEGETTITNVAHLKHKETDRLTALATQLTKLGVKVQVRNDGLIIIPQKMHGAIIETYNDHRIAMSFAVAGLRIPGIEIVNPSCVSKSFPNFWEEFSKIEGTN